MRIQILVHKGTNASVGEEAKKAAMAQGWGMG